MNKANYTTGIHDKITNINYLLKKSIASMNYKLNVNFHGEYFE